MRTLDFVIDFFGAEEFWDTTVPEVGGVCFCFSFVSFSGFSVFPSYTIKFVQ